MSGYNAVPLTDPETGDRPTYAEEGRDEENPPAGASIFPAKSLRPAELLPESARTMILPAAVLLFFFLIVMLGRLSQSRKGGDLSSLTHELHEVKEELEDLTKEIKRLKLAIEKGH